MPSGTLSKDCTFCGDAPVNHAFQYLDTGIELGLSAITPFSRSRAPRFLDFERSPFIRAFARVLLGLLSLVGVVRFSEDISETKSSRVKTIWKEALARGIRVQEIVVFGQRRGDIRAWLPRTKGSDKHIWHYFQTVPIPPWIPQDGVNWVDDKREFKARFERAGLPVPKGGSTASYAKALELFRMIDAPVITKPRSGSRGRHTTVAIESEEEFKDSFERAKELCPFVIVEEFVPGNIYRATCVAGKMIGLMELVRPVTVADGKMTAEELRQHHNQHGKKYSSLTEVKDDALFRGTIAHQGYALDSVPPAGTEILLAEYSERSNGGYFIDLTDDVPDSTREVIERATEACEVSLVGFDIVSKDIANSNERFVFLEGNTLPFIEIHDIPYAGTPRSVSAALWDLWV